MAALADALALAVEELHRLDQSPRVALTSSQLGDRFYVTTTDLPSSWSTFAHLYAGPVAVCWSVGTVWK